MKKFHFKRGHFPTDVNGKYGVLQDTFSAIVDIYLIEDTDEIWQFGEMKAINMSPDFLINKVVSYSELLEIVSKEKKTLDYRLNNLKKLEDCMKENLQ